jgi:hypothetical protein
MTYTISNSLRDREYNKFLSGQSSGSFAAVATSELIQTYSFSIGSITATNTGTNSGGNFRSYSEVPIMGAIQSIEWASGNNTNGSLFLFKSGGAQPLVWSTITRTLASSFEVYPRAKITEQTDAVAGSIYTNPILNNSYIMLVGSDIGKGKSGLALNITYTGGI